jgi:hypothetical protein
MGDAFAEYDRVLLRPNVFVKTPALTHVMDPHSAKCFYVGRRGTGKTAITLYVESQNKRVVVLNPQIIAPESVNLEPEKLKDVHQRDFKTLVSSFKRAIVLEVLANWIDKHDTDFDKLPQSVRKVRNEVEQLDFDLRLLEEMEGAFEALATKNEREWLRHINGTKELITKLSDYADDSLHRILLIDKIDDTWDGSDKSVAFLAGLMHACIEIAALKAFIRPILFLRENIYDRVRKFDSEFAKLQSSVVSMDWSKPLLLEMIERRLNEPSNQKLPLDGSTRDYFFERYDGKPSGEFVFAFCQERPRDALSFCMFAIEAAQEEKKERVTVENMQAARKRFSETRLKELGDEYAENYPHLQVVLGKFCGLGNRYTLEGLEAFIKKLLVADDVQEFCSKWIFQHTSPERFVHLLFGIGFLGVGEIGAPEFRSLGASSSTPPPSTPTTQFVIHPSYADALILTNVLVTDIDSEIVLRSDGVDHDKPEGISLQDYIAKLTALDEDLKTLPHGKEATSAGEQADQRFEEIVGDVIKLCFFRSLINIAPKQRNMSGRVIRDWMATNTATSGYWEMVRLRYHAIEIPWECKNYEHLEPNDFRQAGSYMTQETGRFSIIVFRGNLSKHYYEHIKSVAADKAGGVILLLNDKDLQVFLRQAKANKLRDQHLQERHSTIVRAMG